MTKCPCEKMKKNVNVFIAVVLCAVLCGGIVWLQTANDEKLGWNIHDSYGEAPAYSNGAAYTNATFAGPANDGGAMALSSRSLGRSGGVSHAGAYAVSYGVSSAPLTSNLSPITSAPAGGGLYETSGGTFNSYGGGGNGGAAMGGAMRGSSSSNSLIASSPITSISSPIAYSTARRGEMSSAWGDNPAQMLAEDPAMAMANAANVGNGFYGIGSAVDYSGSTNYGQYTGMFGGGRMGVRGRQNAPNSGGATSSWQNWLLNVWLPSQNGAWGTQGEDGNWYITEDQLRAAYDAFMSGSGWTPGFDGPSFEDWLAWFNPYGYGDGLGLGDNLYFWVPVGDIVPLLLFALLYMLFVSLKSLKTERSE